MNNPMFILKDEPYKNGLFPQIPDYHKRGSWFLLSEGVYDDVIVDDRTTVKQIRQGRYKKLVEISKVPLSYEHEFNSSCKETSYTFMVKVKAMVRVIDPIDLYNNINNLDIKAFFNNQFSLDVNKITRKYSILDYNGIDDDLTRELTSRQVADTTTGLSYQISTVMTEPNAEARAILKRHDDINIQSITKKMEMLASSETKKLEIITADATNTIAENIATKNRDKTYADALMEEVAHGNISRAEAILKIDEYNRKGFDGKLEELIRLREQGIITNADIEMQKTNFLAVNAAPALKALPANETAAADGAAEFYDGDD